MKREVLTEDLRRLYGSNDMVKADCGGCQGCWACCCGMGESVILDPLDVQRLSVGLSCSPQQLLEDSLELNVSEGVILPNLRMKGAEEKCSFLDERGRCRVHEFRPGICRLFPLGRYYEDGKKGFRYFLQSRECPKEKKTKIKVSRWLEVSDLGRYEQYISDWHYLLEDTKKLMEEQQDQQLARDLNTYLLNSFYLTEYDGGKNFYEQFEERQVQFRKLLNVLSK